MPRRGEGERHEGHGAESIWCGRRRARLGEAMMEKVMTEGDSEAEWGSLHHEEGSWRHVRG
jgi:hypothetical protein